MLDKEILYKALWALALIIVAYKFLPYLFTSIKESIFGPTQDPNDIDVMIKREKEKLKSQYLIKDNNLIPNELYVGDEKSTSTPANKKVAEIYRNLSWGDGELHKETKALITKAFGYTLSDTKVSSFFHLIKSKNYLQYLQEKNIENKKALVNYLSCTLIFHIMIEENKEKSFDLTDKIAKRCQMKNTVFQLAFQLKMLENLKLKTPLKEDKKFVSTPILNQISQDTLQGAIERILQKESNLWASDINHFNEELSLYLKEAEVIAPLPPLKNKHDLEAALNILNCDENSTEQEIKQSYKKLALLFHPDRMLTNTKSDYLVKLAQKKFNLIKEAYDIVNAQKK